MNTSSIIFFLKPHHLHLAWLVSVSLTRCSSWDRNGLQDNNKQSSILKITWSNVCHTGRGRQSSCFIWRIGASILKIPCSFWRKKKYKQTSYFLRESFYLQGHLSHQNRPKPQGVCPISVRSNSSLGYAEFGNLGIFFYTELPYTCNCVFTFTLRAKDQS